MPQIVTDQRSGTWLAAREGEITASLAAAILGVDPHQGPLAAYNQIAGKRKAENHHMAWGRQHEQEARHAYQIATGNLVTETGFWVHELCEWLGASPDGLIDHDGLVEIKCPGTLPSQIPPAHEIQMRVQMCVCDRAWCDYFAYVPSVGQFLQRIERDGTQEIKMLVDLDKWYQDHVVTKIAPPRRKKK